MSANALADAGSGGWSNVWFGTCNLPFMHKKTPLGGERTRSGANKGTGLLGMEILSLDSCRIYQAIPVPIFCVNFNPPDSGLLAVFVSGLVVFFGLVVCNV